MSQVDIKVETLRNKILNFVLITLSVLGLLNVILGIYRSTQFGEWDVFYIQLAISITLIITTIFRKQLSVDFKTYTLSGLAITAVASGLYGFGFLASSKVILATFPIFLSFLISYKRAIQVLLLFLVIFAVFAILYSTKTLEYHYNLNDYVTNYRSWIQDYITISIVAWGLLYVGYHFEKAIYDNYKQIEAQNNDLKDNEEKYRTLFENSNDAIILIEDGKYVSCNRKTYELFKCNETFLIGKNPAEFSPTLQPDGEDSLAKATKLFAKSIDEEPQVFDWQHLKENGEPFDVSISLNVVLLNNKKYTQAVLRDITEKKAIEEELNQHRNNLEQIVAVRTQALEASNSELQTKNQIISEQNRELTETMEKLHETQQSLIKAEKMASLGILTSGVAHEINNPLNYIMGGYIGLHEYFERNEPKESETIELLLNSIKTGVERTSSIVKELNQLRGDSLTTSEPCEIHSIIEHCLVMLENRIPSSIKIDKNLSQGQLSINGNNNKLHQLFLNILLNAIQSIDNEGIITIFAFLEGNNIKTTITDTGIGIIANELSKITDPFFTTKDPGKGTGLGLSIAYHIVQEHHGKLEFESEIGKGTVVTIVLPTQG